MEKQEEETTSSVREKRGSCNMEKVFEELKPYIYTLFYNFCYAGNYIISKISLNKGMSPYVLVVYAHAFGTLATALLAFLFERNNDTKISIPILRNVFFLGLIGVVLGRTLFYAGLEYATPTFTSALANLTLSIIFILAVLCRMEKIKITKRGSQAKIGGTFVAFAGATLMTLYKGSVLISPHDAQHSNQTADSDKNFIKGSVMLVIAFCSQSAFYIILTVTFKKYPAPMTLTSLTCLSGTLLSTIMTLILDHKASSWRLLWNISLLAPIYDGVVIYGIANYVQMLLIQKKKRGPVFTIASRPLITILVAILGLLILGEALYLGSVIGAILIVLGLYAILWGKENEKAEKLSGHTISKECIKIEQEK